MNRTERRLANQRNAQSSTGPVTPEGKETSKMNALKHGLTAMKPYLPSEEADYLAFAASYHERIQPETDFERLQSATAIDLQWRLRRIPVMEARLFADPEADPHKTIKSLDTLSRHESRLRKLLDATTKDLLMAIELRRKHQQRQALAQAAPQNGFVLQKPDPAQTEQEMDLVDNAVNQAATPEEGEATLNAWLNHGTLPQKQAA